MDNSFSVNELALLKKNKIQIGLANELHGIWDLVHEVRNISAGCIAARTAFHIQSAFE